MVGSGRDITLTVIRDLINAISLINIRKSNVKRFLPAVFGKNNPYCKIESLLAFYANVSVADTVNTI